MRLCSRLLRRQSSQGPGCGRSAGRRSPSGPRACRTWDDLGRCPEAGKQELEQAQASDGQTRDDEAANELVDTCTASRGIGVSRRASMCFPWGTCAAHRVPSQIIHHAVSVGRRGHGGRRSWGGDLLLPWTSSPSNQQSCRQVHCSSVRSRGTLQRIRGEFEAEVLAMHSGKVLASRRVRWRVQSREARARRTSRLSSVAWSATDTRSQAEADDLHQAPPSPCNRKASTLGRPQGMQASPAHPGRSIPGRVAGQMPPDGRVGQVIEVVRLSGGQRHRAKVIETNLLEIQ